MTPRRALTAGLVLAAAAATASPAFSHTGGSTGFAAIVIGRNRIRYSLMLWPATMPPAVAEDLRLTRAGHDASRDRLLGVIRDKVTLVAQAKRCEAGLVCLSADLMTARSVASEAEAAGAATAKRARAAARRAVILSMTFGLPGRPRCKRRSRSTTLALRFLPLR